MKTMAAKVDSRGRVVLPREIRQQLNIHQGDTLLFMLEGDVVHLLRQPENYADYTRGLGKEMWAKLGGGERFLDEDW